MTRPTFDECAEEMKKIAARVGAERKSDSAWFRSGLNRSDAQALGLGFRERKPWNPADAETTSSPIKYIVRAPRIIEDIRPSLPLFEGYRRGYELGVGPGYLMRALIDVYGIEMRGCDIEIGRFIHDDLRLALGLSEIVEEFRVRPGQTTPIPLGTDFVVAMGTVYDTANAAGEKSYWTVEDYEWFLRDIAGQAAKPTTMIWRFNRWWGAPEQSHLHQYFAKIGRFPLKSDRRLCVIDLAQFR